MVQLLGARSLGQGTAVPAAEDRLRYAAQP